MPVAQITAARPLHSCARKREVQRAGVGGVGQEEPDYFAPLDAEPIARFPVHQQNVAEPAHQRVSGRLLPEWHHSSVRNQQVVEHQDRLAVDRPVPATITAPHQQVAVETQFLLDVLANVAGAAGR